MNDIICCNLTGMPLSISVWFAVKCRTVLRHQGHLVCCWLWLMVIWSCIIWKIPSVLMTVMWSSLRCIWTLFPVPNMFCSCSVCAMCSCPCTFACTRSHYLHTDGWYHLPFHSSFFPFILFHLPPLILYDKLSTKIVHAISSGNKSKALGFHSIL